MRGLVVTLAVLELPLLATFVGIGFVTGEWGYALGGCTGIAAVAVAVGAVAVIRKAEGR